MKCYNCNKDLILESTENVSRSAECDFCHTDLRCCMMCEFYDTTAYNECKEPMADRIVDKDKANFCDYFKINQGSTGAQKKDDALSAAEALFKK